MGQTDGTKTDSVEVVEILRALQRLGWPVETFPSVPAETVYLWSKYHPHRFEAEVRDWIEQQISARGMWEGYLLALQDLVVQDAPPQRSWRDNAYRPLWRRPTLLEVARAALRAAEGGETC